MAKSKKSEFSPEEAVQFLEDMRNLAFDIDQKTVAISLRVPENILRAVKMQANSENKKYQSLMVEYIRQGLKKKGV